MDLSVFITPTVSSLKEMNPSMFFFEFGILFILEKFIISFIFKISIPYFCPFCNLKKIKVNEYLIPIENRVEYFPNGKIKKEEIFHSEYAIKIDVHYTLSGIVYEKIIMLKDNNYILLKNKHGELEIISNNLNIKEFCEENILKIEDVYELLPLILINFL